ncbi:hypothetical protein ACHAXA_001590 [Cyclostephanos tholiformis]|jgi:hypothetical protein|uniref:F-box domain-containing protein n=1 Tax=Cyclostephanos tholiformis TaxID=382380 RepID=A0ABD3RT06_9STRA
MLTDESTLPRHVLVNSVLAYIDLCSLIKFSCTSKACRDVVFLNVPKARWRRIDLSGNSRITDEQLRVFLENIDARTTTRILSLVGCPNVNGTGLEPLRGSIVMEDIDLRVRGSLPLVGDLGKLRGPSGLREDCVAEILRSMLPILPGQPVALRRVAIRPAIRPHLFDNAVRPLHMFLGDELQEQRPPSHDTPRHLYYGPAICRFLRLHDSFRKSLSPSDPRYCDDGPDSCSLCGVAGAVLCDSSCNGRFCTACALPQDCPECDKRKCQWCSTIVMCASCGKRSCASHGYEGCGGCGVIFCQDCHVDKLDFSIVRNEYCCSQCEPPYWGGNIR